MALNTNFNVNPYYDDFDETKKYLRLLFKPGYAVQARELTQLQTILQKQVERFGDHIFKNGSVVTGGQFFLQSATYLKLDSAYSGVDINANNFVGMTILSTDETKRGEVIKAFAADDGTGDPITLMVKQVYGSPFVSSETIKTKETSPVFANVSTSGVGTGQIFSVNEGVFYYDGFFVQNDAQTVAVSKYTNTTANARIGFEITESIVTNNSDTSLLDPAQNASNYQAPGSDRYKINLVLATRSLASTDDTQFIELALVENGQISKENRYPIYSVLEDTLARRTYDESGNYTVRDFKISLGTNSSNTAQTDVIMSPGKAYVYGYEFETNGPTTLTIDKPRTTDSIANKRITADYGNFVYTTNHYGSFPINSLQTVDLHVVNTASINTTSTASITNTKIGTARVKSMAYESASNTSNGSTYTYRSFLFDVSVGSITGTVNTATSTTVVIGNTGAGQVFSTINDAYTGAKLRITSGPGSNETPKLITDFVGSTQTLTVEPAFTTTPNSTSQFSIDFEFNDVESLANFSTTTRVVSADVSNRSKDLATTYEDAYISDSAFEPLIFKLGESYIAQNTISDFSFSYKRLYASQAFTANDSPALTLGTGEDIASATSTSAKAENYYIVVTNAGTSSYSVGQVIPADKFTVDTGTNKITVTGGQNMTANIIATIDVSTISKKQKTYVSANTTIQTSGGVNVFGNSAVVIYPSNGQCHIAASYVNKVPNQTQSLFMSDLIEITNILDFRGNVISVANASFASNVTTRYTFDNGQRDSFYDHSSIKLKPGQTAPQGPLVVFFNRFTSSGPGFFTVDSYSDVSYGNIPSYSSPTNNTLYNLRDCLDFRPVRSDATASGGSAVVFDVSSTTTGPKIPENGSDIILDYQYYLPRIDKVVLDKTKKFEIVKGVPSLNPYPPNDTTTGMTLFILAYQPYLADTKDINVQQINHKRYTMRDIGRMETRIDNLEYYTSLSFLEQDALTKQDLTILDNQNVERFKNGIVVDSFKGHSVADVTNADYSASIDTVSKYLRPSFNISAHTLNFDAANSSNFTRTGSLITANSTPVTFIEQLKASKSINVNPFNVINYLGKIKLSPASDTWIDTQERPDVLVNIGGDRDAWQLITSRLPSTLEWNSWQTIWTGTSTDTFTELSGRIVSGAAFGRGGLGREVVETVVSTTTESQTRSGIVSQVVPQTITQTLGDRIVDVSIIPFMRNINVLFVGTDFKPSTTLYPFFDDASIENYVGDRINKYYLTSNNIGFNVNYSNPEVVNIRDKSAGVNVANAVVVLTSNNIVYVSNMAINTSYNFATANAANLQLVGAQTGLTYNVATYEHNGGIVNTATSSSVTLRIDAQNASNQNTINGSVIFITQGKGAGQSATITSYNVSTRTANISGTWTTTPDTTSHYGIGRLTTDPSGSVVGIFSIPSGTFRVGEKQLRLTDTSSGDIPSSTTNGDASFFAQGILQTKQETIVSTVQPIIQRTAVNENRVVSGSPTVISQRPVGVVDWFDPLAQTFLISPQQYPQGLFLSKIRLCFKTKDDIVPVTLQLRPAVNGFPSSSVVYPFSTVSLTPDKVKVSTSPSMDNANTYTDFVFDSPVYLQPGEHSFVVLANSNKYELYVAEIGKLDIVAGRQISEQPYGGSLFLSQNGSTWTADQTSDMMFRLYRSSFTTSTVTTQFTVDSPSTVVPYQLAQLITSDIVVANTSLSYQFNSEKADGSGFAGLTSITPLQNLEITDGIGRRLSNTTGNITFTLAGTMATLSNDVSPVIDASRVAVLAIENEINNLGLSNSGVVIANSGSGYANSADITVTISGGGGSGATAVANVVANTIDAVYITSAGSGYTSSPTITITPGSGGGANASVTYNGETEKSGGNGTARYITRRVTLADGFDSGDLRVYLNANKPSGTNIYVYYKILSASDPETLNDKSWQLMTEIGNANFVSLNDNDNRELLFAPGANGIANNSVSYTSGSTAFTTFRTFAIKIVMTSSVIGVVPKIQDMRAIALPAG
jgi:hypothetical protein